MEMEAKSVQTRAGHRSSEAAALAQHDSIESPLFAMFARHIKLAWSSRRSSAATTVVVDDVRKISDSAIDCFISVCLLTLLVSDDSC